MMVPSRSRNTAGDLALVEVMFEARDQLVARDGGGAGLTHSDGAGVIGDLCGLKRRRLAYERECEDRDRSVTRTGNIENIPSFRWNMVRPLAFFEKHHPVFAESNEEILRAPFLKKLFSGTDKIEISVRG